MEFVDDVELFVATGICKVQNYVSSQFDMNGGSSSHASNG